MILLLGLIALALFIGFVVGVLSMPEDEAVQRHREQRAQAQQRHPAGKRRDDTEGARS